MHTLYRGDRMFAGVLGSTIRIIVICDDVWHTHNGRKASIPEYHRTV